ncbi:MAG: catabolic regulation response regulator [Pseudomonadota bacterium]|jgi:two-component system catabolic regulation response regulator CreB
MPLAPSLLLLEDDPAIANMVTYALSREGYVVEHVTSLGEARQRLRQPEAAFGAAILDVGLPDGSGLDLCRELRQAGGSQASLPVLMLSARSEELDRVLGLELGADDYVTKPFSPRELCARVRALLRRSALTPAPATPATAAPPPGLVCDTQAQRVSYQGQPLPLTRREFGLLQALLKAPGRIWSREALLDVVWGQDADSTDRTVDTHIKTLRAKLRDAGCDADLIGTHRGMGYAIDPARL